MKGDILAGEYALTEAGLGAWTEFLVSAVISWSEDIEEEAARRMVVARKESMIGELKMLKEDYGGAEKYFKEKCGLDDEKIAKIKGYLIVDENPVCETWREFREFLMKLKGDVVEVKRCLYQ